LDDGTHRSRLTCSFVPLEGEQSTAYCRNRRRWFDRFSTAATYLGDAQITEAMPHNRTARIPSLAAFCCAGIVPYLVGAV